MATKERFDAMVSECKRLRAKFSDAGVNFYAGIMRFEADESTWRSGVDGPYGWATFGQALHQTNLLKLHRLEKFKCMVEICGGIENVRRIGLQAAEDMLYIPKNAMSRLVAKTAVNAVLDELLTFRIERGNEPSGQTAKTLRIKHCPPQPKVEEPKVENAYDRLVIENKKLKSMVKKLEKENEVLKGRLASAGMMTKPMGPLANRKSKRDNAKTNQATS